MNNSIPFYVIKIKEYAISLVVLLFFMLLVVFSRESQIAAKDGLELFMFSIFPSIFPFLVLSSILINTNITEILQKSFNGICIKLFNLPGIAIVPIFLGILGGYPIGAKICNELYNSRSITKKNAELLLGFTNNSGPLFIIAYVGISLYTDARTGFLLLSTHIMSALIVGIFLGLTNRKNLLIDDSSIIYPNLTKISSNNNFLSIFVSSVKDSVNNILIIGGFIVFFSVIINLLQNSNFFLILSIPINFVLGNIGIDTSLTIPVLHGLVEMSTGLFNISKTSNVPYISKICASSFILGCGGFSIYMQLCAITIKNNFKTHTYIIGKLLHGIVAYILTFALTAYTPFFNLTHETGYIKPSIPANVLWKDSQIDIFFNVILCFFVFIALLKMYQIGKKKDKNNASQGRL